MGMPNKIGKWKVIVLSFMGACTFWFFSALGKEYNSRIKYPIEFVYNTDSLVAIQPLPEFVDVEVSGGGWNLFRESFWFGSDPILFELENPAAIRYLTRATIFPIVSEQLNEFRINFLFTDTLHVDIDRKVFKKVSLRLDSASISMDEDYRIVSPIATTPDTAWIFGPASFIDTLKDDYTFRLETESIDKTFERFVKMGLPEEFDIYSEPPTVNVQFEVARFDKLELATTVEPQNFPEDSSVFVTYPEITIRFAVQRSLREEYYAEDFKVVVDYNLINEADSLVPAIIIFHPEHVLEVETSPDSLAVTYAR